jgi:signal transduction histidine kinase
MSNTRDLAGLPSRFLLGFPALLSVTGGLIVLFAIVQAVFVRGFAESPLLVVLDFVLVSAPGLVLLYTGRWLPNSAIDPQFYPRILAWLLGGIGVMFGFILLRDLHPGVTVDWSLGTQSIALALGSIGGLLIGVQETRATMRTQELSEREQALQRQNEQLEEFAGIVSHDLRNPLNVAEGHLELARQECDNDRLDSVADAHDRMDRLIDDLLALARQGDRVRTIEPVSLSDVARGCWESVATAEATLEVDTEGTIRADRDRLQQLLENLVRNSVEHGREDVTVTIGALADGSGFYVEDDGPGIPGDARERVFESGYSTAAQGTGFGLAIVSEIVDAHGWEVRITDSASGGARFEIAGVELL